MNIMYMDTKEIQAEDVSRVFETSGINRPYQDFDRLKRMIENSDIVITAWHEGKMIGMARAVTDYSYCCYLSDLAIDKDYQKGGIGRKLVDLVKEKMGEECSLVLLSAPGAMDYYEKLGFSKVDNAFVIKRVK
ncbi:GNAT family N-acetyltransferase [Paenibacillus sp. CAU 1523]|uniref:GNAT family N-acetyltransferase n=1 Tax=Paenibacillus arenosi TaxID=2774142 RepID=A0ABR9ASY9_9BACL|nr:GNAT family N-acetyltransferase [Paenibacillus arenosi]